MKRKYSKKVFSLIFILVILLCLIPMKVNSINTYDSRFVLAFSDNTTPLTIIRYSNDGINWESGNFPSADHYYASSHGPGLMAHDNGVLHFLMYDSLLDGGSISFAYGLVDIWDQSSRSTPISRPYSAPAGAHLEDNLYIITYQTSNDDLFVGIWNESSRDFLPGNYAPTTYNSNIYGRPSITILNGLILLAWTRWVSQDYYQLITTTGTFDGSYIILETPIEVSLPYVADSYMAGCQSQPDVCNDGETFYITVIREESSSGLHGWDAILLESTSGDSWTNQRVIDGSARRYSYVNIACGTGGKLLLAYIRDEDGGTSNTIHAKLYDPQNGWSSQSIDIDDMFGQTSAYPRQFSLISSKMITLRTPIGWFTIISSILLTGIIGYVLNIKKKEIA
ncbi:MAG: hypothetical protein GPJ52_00140 [Candidatus Heimdallarchaeota archaeon]|nr:hypothetical protein [Candidatus Heimdallarchaeota archaeon]